MFFVSCRLLLSFYLFKFVIKVVEIDKDNFQVFVKSKSNTNHYVFFSDEYLSKYKNQIRDKKQIVHDSFIFLLERESNNQIMKSFNIEIIKDYFSEYKNLFLQQT